MKKVVFLILATILWFAGYVKLVQVTAPWDLQSASIAVLVAFLSLCGIYAVIEHRLTPAVKRGATRK